MNWYKKAQSDIFTYYDIGHQGHNLGRKIKQEEEKMWIITKDGQFYDVDTTGKQSQTHGSVWPQFAEETADNIMGNYLAKGRYENNKTGKNVSIILSPHLDPSNPANEKKIEYAKKTIDNILKMQYPSANLYWF